MNKECEKIGESVKDFLTGEIIDTKAFTCLELPVKYITKPIGEWMCMVCAKNLLSGSEDF